MQLEAGKFYKTRDGRKAYVAAVGNPLDAASRYQANGWVGPDCCTWTTEGHLWANRAISNGDLVAEWVEPVAKTVEVVLMTFADGKVFPHVGPVGTNWAQQVIARRTITLTEGEGV